MTYDTAALLEFATQAAWQAGRVTLAHFQTGVVAERKGDNSPVTVADRAAEHTLRELIATTYPDHAILGEEFGGEADDARPTWIIDPIDGTKSFVAGVPLYAVLLALVIDRRPQVGVMHFPGLNETISAGRGMGCYWNGRRARVSGVDQLKDATLLFSDLPTFAQAGYEAAWQRLIAATYIQRTWGDSYGYALVATGRAEIMLDPIMQVWDCGPLQVIMEEAGGRFADFLGTPTIFGGSAIATNTALFDDVMAIVRGEF